MEKNKKDYISLIAPILLTFIIQFIIDYNFSKGVIEVLDFNNSSILKIENLSDKQIDDLIVVVPSNYNADLISSNNSISISRESEKVLLSKDKKIIKFSLIPFDTKTIIYFNDLNSKDIMISNYKSFNLELVKSYDKTKDIVISSLITTLIYGIMFFILWYYNMTRNHKIYLKQKEIEKSLEDTLGEIENIKRKDEEINLKNEKRAYTSYLIDNEIFLFYKKENEFWRNLFFDKLHIKGYEKKKFLEDMEKEFKTSNKFKINYDERLKTFEIMKEIFEKEIKNI